MKRVGIICEYNPFHLGHQRQIKLIRKELGSDTAIICAMSGNYVQRGLPAMWDKYTRAKSAVACGADLVVELPITKCLQSAEGFAVGGVEILDQIGIDYLSFGAECGNPDALMLLAQKISSDSFQLNLREKLDLGLPYAAARQQALQDSDDILSKPNNILGLEYCRAILNMNPNIQPFVIQRNGDYHSTSPDEQEPSATFIRSIFPDDPWGQYIPEAAFDALKQKPWYDVAFGERAILARLRSLSDSEWSACAHGSEGLWSKAMKASRSEPDLEHIIQAVKSKRYPRTRIQRLLICAYLGIKQADLSAPIPYIRILAFSDLGRHIIRHAKQHMTIPLINPGETPEHNAFFRLEVQSADLFSLFAAPAFPCPCLTEQHARFF